MILISFLVMNLLGGLTLASDNFDDSVEDFDDPLENPDLFEGDIELDEDSDDRSAVISKKMLWPNGIVPYLIKEVDLNEGISKEKIEAAIEEYNKVTCLKFVPMTKEKSYLQFVNGTGCHTRIGYRIGTVHQIVLGRGCNRVGTILHEIGHAIGFYHENTRADRNKYIQVLWQNIKPGKEIQFKQRLPGKELLLSPFDFNSTMLYGSTSFSKDKPRLPTMLSLVKHQKLPSIKDRLRLSPIDIMRVNKLYGCKKL